MGRVKTLLKDTAWFAIGNFGSKILSLLLVPLYTSILTTEQYGIIDVISTTSNLIIPLLTLSIADAVLRFALDKEEDKKGVITTGLLIIAGATLLLLALRPIFRWLLPMIDTYWVYFVGVFTGTCFSTVVANYAKACGRSDIFAMQGVIHTLCLAASNIILLVYYKAGVSGYLFSIGIAHFVSVIYTAVAGKIWKDISFRHIKLEQTKKLVRYSMPMIPAAISWWIMSAIDRYMILYMCGTDANGLYSVAHKIPSILTVVTMFFINAWQIAAIKTKDDTDSDRFVSSVFRILISVGFLAAFMTIILSQPLGKILYAKDFFEAWRLTPCLTVSAILSVYTSFIGAQFSAALRSDLHMKSNILAMVSNIFLNGILIRWFGVDGAAYATTLSFLLMLLYRLMKLREIMTLHYPFAKVIGGSGLMLLASLVISAKLPYYGIYVGILLLVVLMIYRREYVQQIKAMKTMLSKKER